MARGSRSFFARSLWRGTRKVPGCTAQLLASETEVENRVRRWYHVTSLGSKAVGETKKIVLKTSRDLASTSIMALLLAG